MSSMSGFGLSTARPPTGTCPYCRKAADTYVQVVKIDRVNPTIIF
jgi:hypothetical protein